MTLQHKLITRNTEGRACESFGFSLVRGGGTRCATKGGEMEKKPLWGEDRGAWDANLGVPELCKGQSPYKMLSSFYAFLRKWTSDFIFLSLE